MERTSEFGKCYWATPWGSQRSLGESFSPFPDAAPKPDPCALVSRTLETAGWLDFILPVGRAALLVLTAPGSSPRLRNNVATCFLWPHTSTPSPPCSPPWLAWSLLSLTWGGRFIGQFPFRFWNLPALSGCRGPGQAGGGNLWRIHLLSKGQAGQLHFFVPDSDSGPGKLRNLTWTDHGSCVPGALSNHPTHRSCHP